MNHISIDEQETVIEYYRTDDRLDIYTSDQTMITKLKKLIAKSDEYEVVDEYKSDDGRTLTIEVKAPKEVLNLRSRSKVTLKLTDEQRAARANCLRENLKKAKETKKNS